jgi:hypothetical protein
MSEDLEAGVLEGFGMAALRVEGAFTDFGTGEVIAEGHPRYAELMAEKAKRDRIRSLAIRLCSNLGLDPDAEVSRNVPQYLGIDVCYPAAYYAPPSTCSLWELFSLQAEMMISIIDEEKSANE